MTMVDNIIKSTIELNRLNVKTWLKIKQSDISNMFIEVIIVGVQLNH